MSETRLGIRSSVFRANHSFFVQKWTNERFAQKNERPERFTHIAHPKRGNERFAHFLNKKTYIKHTKKQDFRFLRQIFLSESLIRSFPLSDSLTVAHFLWATWVICSWSLICLERSERIAQSRSFDLIEMSEWANSQPWSEIPLIKL